MVSAASKLSFSIQPFATISCKNLWKRNCVIYLVFFSFLFLYSWREGLETSKITPDYKTLRFIAEVRWARLKFMYSEKATQFCEISTVDLSYVVPVKSTVEILQNFVAFSEYMNFNVIVLTKISMKFLISALASKSGQIKKI